MEQRASRSAPPSRSTSPIVSDRTNEQESAQRPVIDPSPAPTPTPAPTAPEQEKPVGDTEEEPDVGSDASANQTSSSRRVKSRVKKQSTLFLDLLFVVYALTT